MKIVYCLPQLFNPGGIERIVTIKANHLAEKFGWDVTIIVAAQNGKKLFYELSDKIKLIDLGLPYFDMLDMPLLQTLSRFVLVARHNHRIGDYRRLPCIRKSEQRMKNDLETILHCRCNR